MSSNETLSGDLTELQHRSRERSLTGHHASRAHHAADSVVLAGSEMILVSDVRGDIPRQCADNRGLGLYYRDTRFLSAYELTLNGASPVPLSSHEGGGSWAFHVLGNPPLESAGRECIAAHTISIRRDRVVGEGAIHDIIAVTNFGAGPAHLSLALMFSADFTDIFVVRGIAEPSPPTVLPAAISENRRVELRSVARDGTRQTTLLGFSLAASRLSAEAACFDLDLASGERRELAVEIAPRFGAAGMAAGCRRDAHDILHDREREGREWLPAACACTGFRSSMPASTAAAASGIRSAIRWPAALRRGRQRPCPTPS